MHDMLHCLQPHIVFDQQRQLPQLMGEPFFETDPIWDQVYPKIQSLASFHIFFHQADAQKLMQTVVGPDGFIFYPMKLGRIACQKN